MLAAIALSTAGVLVAFGAGLVSFLSPCVLPLVPGYVSLCSGISLQELERPDGSTRSALVVPLVGFVAGFSVVFTALGAAASAIGAVLVAHRVVLDEVAGALIVVMGLALAGAVPARLLAREWRFSVRPASLGRWAAPVMGMAFAAGWTPCIGPALGAILGLAGSTATLSEGVGLLLAYSLGLGVPFVVVGLASSKLASTMRRARRAMSVVEVCSGLLLAAFGLLLLVGGAGLLSSDASVVLRAVGLGRLAG
jgi:cytochrome c-type biogenesis protein